MKTFKFITTLLLFSFLFTGCMSREDKSFRDKALEIIKNDLTNTMDDFDSYELINSEFSRLNLDYLGDTMVQNLIKEIRKADSVVALRRDKDMEAYRSLKNYSGYPYYNSLTDHKGLMRWSKTSSERYEAEQKRLILVDSLLSLVEKQDSTLFGWKVKCKFRHKRNEASPEIYDCTYYMDKDCIKILINASELSWSDDDVEYANIIYDEALERIKKCHSGVRRLCVNNKKNVPPH